LFRFKEFFYHHTVYSRKIISVETDFFIPPFRPFLKIFFGPRFSFL